MVLSNTRRTSALALSALLATVSAGAAAAVAPAMAADLPDPDLHYDFDNDNPASGVITDTSGSEHHGTLVNSESAAIVRRC